MLRVVWSVVCAPRSVFVVCAPWRLLRSVHSVVCAPWCVLRGVCSACAPWCVLRGMFSVLCAPSCVLRCVCVSVPGLRVDGLHTCATRS